MAMPNPNELITRILGLYLDPTKSYPRPLPAELHPWYCYTIDGGHNILIAVQSLLTESKNPEEFLVPAPVKTVLRGYHQQDGYIVVDLPYDLQLGLIAPDGDEEM